MASNQQYPAIFSKPAGSEAHVPSQHSHPHLASYEHTNTFPPPQQFVHPMGFQKPRTASAEMSNLQIDPAKSVEVHSGAPPTRVEDADISPVSGVPAMEYQSNFAPKSPRLRIMSIDLPLPPPIVTSGPGYGLGPDPVPIPGPAAPQSPEDFHRRNPLLGDPQYSSPRGLPLPLPSPAPYQQYIPQIQSQPYSQPQGEAHPPYQAQSHNGTEPNQGVYGHSHVPVTHPHHSVKFTHPAPYKSDPTLYLPYQAPGIKARRLTLEREDTNRLPQICPNNQAQGPLRHLNFNTSASYCAPSHPLPTVSRLSVSSMAGSSSGPISSQLQPNSANPTSAEQQQKIKDEEAVALTLTQLSVDTTMARRESPAIVKQESHAYDYVSQELPAKRKSVDLQDSQLSRSSPRFRRSSIPIENGIQAVQHPRPLVSGKSLSEINECNVAVESNSESESATTSSDSDLDSDLDSDKAWKSRQKARVRAQAQAQAQAQARARSMSAQYPAYSFPNIHRMGPKSESKNRAVRGATRNAFSADSFRRALDADSHNRNKDGNARSVSPNSSSSSPSLSPTATSPQRPMYDKRLSVASNSSVSTSPSDERTASGRKSRNKAQYHGGEVVAAGKRRSQARQSRAKMNENVDLDADYELELEAEAEDERDDEDSTWRPEYKPSYTMVKKKKGKGPSYSRESDKKQRKGPGGPLPASEIKVDLDDKGIKWIKFQYTRKGVAVNINMRADIDSVHIDSLKDDFKVDNSLYPSAMCTREAYKGNRWEFETSCNAIGWQLARLNPSIRSQRGLLQRAVDSFRNVSDDPRHHSRRTRRFQRRDQLRMYSSSV